MSASDIVVFWRRAGPQRWFSKDTAFDAEIGRLFKTAHHAAARGEYSHWTAQAEGALALLLLLDQFPRNLYRGSAHAFATDPLARQVARQTIDHGLDREVDPALRTFFYLPFEHSERLADQDRAVNLFQAAGEDPKWALIHRDIIARFGRFPHRNACLGRETTPEEQAFLDAGGFAG